MATPVRDWATVDYYALLGIGPDASADDVARAFRAAAKRSHPDATGDPAAAERFGELTVAYKVLSDRRARRDYDRVRAERAAVVAAPRAPATAPVGSRETPARWTRRRAWTAFVGGIAVTVLGIAAGVFTWSLHARDADARRRFVPVTAQRLAGDRIAFTTRDGRRVVAREPHLHGEGTTDATVGVRYDPAAPQHVVLDASTFGRDITLAIVACKLLIGGPVFAILGARHLRRGSVRGRHLRRHV